MKIFPKISIITLSIAGVILITFPIHIFPYFYDVRYMGISSLLGALIIYAIPKLLRVGPHQKDAQTKNNATDLFQFLITFIILSNALGDLGFYQLYKVGFEFDKFIHLLSPFLWVFIFPLVLEKRFGIKKIHSIAIAISIALLSGLAWELFEYMGDQVFKIHIYGVYGSDIDIDTKLDLIFDALGILWGALCGVFLTREKK